MQDFISKGNGNSRFLKSSLPTGTTWEDALAHLKNGDFPIDLNGINMDGITQLGTPLNKANLLSDATAAKFSKYKQLASFAVGDTIQLKVNGTPKDFIVVHQGKPSSMYDDSCDGTWLLMKDCYENRQWHSSNVNSYKDSTIHSYLNSTFLDLFDSNIKSAIKQVKIPYVNGTGGSAVASGSNGLSTKVFLLSGCEVGFTASSYSTPLPIDGAKLDYFVADNGATAKAKRVANLNGAAYSWWLRSPYNNNTTHTYNVQSSGTGSSTQCMSTFGIRPALVLPSTKYYDPDDYVVYDDASDVPQTPNEAFSKIASLFNTTDGAIADLQTVIANMVHCEYGTVSASGYQKTITTSFKPQIVLAMVSSSYPEIIVAMRNALAGSMDTVSAYKYNSNVNVTASQSVWTNNSVKIQSQNSNSNAKIGYIVWG